MTKANFADRVFEAVEKKKSHVAVGLDPRPELLPSHLLDSPTPERGNNPAGVAGAVVNFNRDIIDAVADSAVAVKCQIAFYERLGIEGLKAYRDTLLIAREYGLIVIGDVKRNDIGSTAGAYAEAHLKGISTGKRGGSVDLHADAVTVNPLFGGDGIKPFTDRAAACGGGVFILVRTSNPTSAELQELECSGRPFYKHIASLVNGWAEGSAGERGYSHVGAVAGATFPSQLSELRSLMPHVPFLIPGFGAQGGSVEDVAGGFDSSGMGALVNSSRGIIYAYRGERYGSRFGESSYKDAAHAAAEDMRSALWKAARGD